ncbi:conserved hypothetical protein [Frankia canadensis]|uniref:Nitroreductase family deazaflavin-dependent oxidoreductase n=1 Tax=Frankia canadensis TaxID=1836972 RepID=A0A2I2L1B4_9ACTN|nr:nitroreductase family deazaflavin-dependent oxidoreductase [Frankia canadensis]SNQ51712.1 conserved hypothetical protein [Frankia canadensis]SOU59002.1 conserved hypothetical protein [Frankia canadensis]
MNRSYLRPSWPARVIGGRMARLFQPAVVHTLTVPGRVTGRPRSIAVAVLEHAGEQYLVSAYGDSEWSRNMRAAGHARLRDRSGTRLIETAEVPPEERSPLLTEYLRKYGRFPTVQRSFDTLPDSADHPTFRIVSQRPA